MTLNPQNLQIRKPDKKLQEKLEKQFQEVF